MRIKNFNRFKWIVTLNGILRASKLLSTAAGIFLGWICFANSAIAVNGATYVNSCACKTSTDFITVGEDTAIQLKQAGTYTVVSNSGPATASIKVQGNLVLEGNHNTVFEVTSAVPVDSNGNSLAGNSENYLEAYFATYDITLIGTNRSQPLTVAEPTNYAESFINADDAEVGPGIDYALAAKGISWYSLPLSAVITVQFADGTSAMYTKDSNMTAHWVWFGIARNKAGQLITRNGSLVNNPNTTGAGGGQVNAPGFGSSGSLYNWILHGGAECTENITIDFPDGSSSIIGAFIVPC